MLTRAPWAQNTKAKHRGVNKDRRRHFISQAIFLLRLAEPTPFAFEGYCRHELRSQLCLEGWDWHSADAIAAEVVLSALNAVGAVRPSWDQGQPEHTQQGAVTSERTRCLQCDGRLPEENSTYCSKRCHDSHYARRHYQDNREKAVAKQRLRWKAWSESQSEQSCPECGSAFRPNYPNQKLCSQGCAVRKWSATGRRAYV